MWEATMRHDTSDEDALHEIRVELGSLQQLTDELSNEVSYRLRPVVSRLFDQYEGGACFGVRSPSADLHAVRSKYADCLRETVDRLATYVQESSLLVDAAGEILARYRSTDALAAASVDDVNKLFSAAKYDDQRGG